MKRLTLFALLALVPASAFAQAAADQICFSLISKPTKGR